MKVVVNAELIKSLNKKKDAAQLNYFKKELIKVLEKNDEEIVSKAIEDYDNSIKKTYSEIGIEKAGYGIGTVRVWKGQKFRKIAPGKWRRIYDSNTRGARQSINIIKKKIANAQSIDELLQLVMENTNRFMDAEGKLLPIVEELQNAVKESKGRLNTGKPSTQDQIEQFKKENPNISSPIQGLIDDANNIPTQLKTFYKGEFKDKESKLFFGEKLYQYIKDVKDKINKLQDDYYKGNTYGLTDNEYDKITDAVANINSDYWLLETDIEELKKEIMNDKIKDEVAAVNIVNLSEEEKKEIQKYDDKVEEFVAKNVEKLSWTFKKDVNDLLSNDIFISEAGKQWLKKHGCYTPEKFYQYVYDRLNDELASLRIKEREAKKKALDEKLNDINSQIKTYSNEEIVKSFESLEKFEEEIEDFKQKVINYNIKTKETDIKYNNRAEELYAAGYRRWDKEFTSDPIFSEIEKTRLDLFQESKDIKKERDEFEKKIDLFIGPIAYYYLNKFDYDKDTRIDDCNTIEEVIDLFNQQDWYKEEGKQNLDIKKVDINAAKDIFKAMERIFAIFPEQKGYARSINTKYENSLTWACANNENGMTLNSKYWENYDSLKESYAKTEGSFHPKGTQAIDIIFHEYYHVMTTTRDLAKKIKERVTKRLKMRGKKGGPKQDDLIEFGISKYALKDADEFGAECFCQALGSKNPTAFAIEVFKETLKAKKYMRGLI